ncbi:MAG: antirestriction protein [Lachnospiraceae bacterium]|nr:antirestriction protein [Lachnospiraceae bacterium]
MRKRIRAIAEGKFDYREIEVRVSEERIEAMARKNEILKGAVLLESNDERKLKGLVYTTDRRMVCDDIQFLGKKVQILYEFHTAGMEEGDTNKGEIYIESNAGEIVVPYVVSIDHWHADSSIGKIRDLFHFANLAQKNYQEAYKLFCSKKFRRIKMDEYQRRLYEALTQINVCRENMEEFLIAIHKKEPVRFFLNASEESYECEGDSFKKEVMLSKNTWGYFQIRIHTDADFIYIEKPVITADDFVGSYYNWEFIVEKKKLHAGKNCAVITFSTGLQTETMKVEIGLPGGRNLEKAEEKKLVAELCELYIQVRNHSIKETVWLKEGTAKAESLNGLVSDDRFYIMLNAQMYAMSGKRTEAVFLLNKIQEPQKLKKENPSFYAYFQYITALIKQEEEFTKLVSREIRELSDQHRHDFWLLLIRLFLDEELENNKVWKYRLLKEQFLYGCRSPFLYLEACLLMKQDMSLYNRLEEFEMQVLAFALRYQMLDRELVDKTAVLAVRLKQFEPLVFRMLTSAYDQFPSAESVEAICSMLIRSNKRNAVYFPWFEKGVSAELKLTQLFEYYLYTIPMNTKRMLPKTLLMYFNYDNMLDYKRKAYLFVNVWKYQQQIGELFVNYEPRIKLFVIEQLLHRHINEDLAYLYRRLSEDILQNPEASAVFEEMVFVHRLVCDNPGVRHVVVKHGELDKEEIFPVADGRAWVKLYHSEAMILLEDKDGRRHLDTIPYSLEALFQEGEIAKYCLKFEKVRLGLLLNRYYKKGTPLREDISLVCEKLLQKQELTKEFRQILIRELIEYYMDSREYEKAQEYLLELDYSRLAVGERAHFTELMISRGMYEEAYNIVLRFGPEQIAPKKLVRLCSRLIVMEEGSEDMLQLCYYVFSRGKYDENILEYLTTWFYGPTWQMERLWRAAKMFEVETYDIGERILIQMLFTGYVLPDSGEIFEDYYKPGYKPEIAKAYLSFFAYYYVVHEQIIDERILQWIEKEYTHGELINDNCRAALLKYYAQMPVVPHEKKVFLSNMLMEFVEKRMVFPFFTQMDPEVAEIAHMSEKTIIEHRAAPDKKVDIFYQLSDGEEDIYRKEEMECIYDSIYIKELTTFYGDRIPYYIMESDGEGLNPAIVTSAVHENQNHDGYAGEGRYQMLNEIAASYHLKDEQSLQELMMKYGKMEQYTEELLKLKDG